MKIELVNDGSTKLILTAENQAEHYQIIALTSVANNESITLSRMGNPYFSLTVIIKE